MRLVEYKTHFKGEINGTCFFSFVSYPSLPFAVSLFSFCGLGWPGDSEERRFLKFIYLWLCWVFVSVRGLSLVAASGGHSSSRCTGLSLSRPLLLRSTGSRRAGSVIVAHGPSCSAARGIFPDQGSNPCPLHWQADSQPLRHQGSPPILSFDTDTIFFTGVWCWGRGQWATGREADPDTGPDPSYNAPEQVIRVSPGCHLAHPRPGALCPRTDGGAAVPQTGDGGLWQESRQQVLGLVMWCLCPLRLLPSGEACPEPLPRLGGWGGRTQEQVGPQVRAGRV